ncbi:unnamed protein product, partial [Calicophoron daubneyi]
MCVFCRRKDAPLITVKPWISDAELDATCATAGVSVSFYKNLANCNLGEYSIIPTDTDFMQTSSTSESLRACYVRMRLIYQMVEEDRIGKATLLKNLHYSIVVMETAYVAEKKRIREEEEDLSEAATEFVPVEVRDWLASTFTRTQPILVPRSRWDFVDNCLSGLLICYTRSLIYRRMSSCSNLNIPPNVLLFLKSELDNWSFDVFALSKASENHALKFVDYELLHKYNLLTKFQ